MHILSLPNFGTHCTYAYPTCVSQNFAPRNFDALFVYRWSL